MSEGWAMRSGILALAVLAVSCATEVDPADPDINRPDGSTNLCEEVSCASLCCGGICVEALRDSNNCGGCGVVCGDGTTCVRGVCTPTCEGGLVCGELCVDVAKHHEHCGACGVQCGPLEVCSEGRCRAGCNPGLNPCAGACVDMKTDANNCGACGQRCGPGMLCRDGGCACEAGFNDCDGNAANGCEVRGTCACTPNAVQSCYSGRAETMGVGICRAGTQRCNAEGTAWGNCDGQVTPRIEVCGNGLDDNCNGEVDENPDDDGDGWGVCDGDCCDSLATGCAVDPAKVNPGAFDFVGNHLDDDCDGVIDNPPSRTCSTATLTSGVTGEELVKAMDLCQFTTASGDKWGVLSAELTRSNGAGQPDQPQVGVLQRFGGRIQPRAGANLAVLSSGTARGVGDSGYVNPTTPSYKTSSSVAAPARYVNAHGGRLQTTAGCPAGDASAVNDSVRLRVRMRVPTNAEGFKFNFRFFSSEYPKYLCSRYNDFFLSILESQHPSIPADGNISFDANNNPVSVNNAFFTTCVPQNCGYSHEGTDINNDGCPDSLTCQGGKCVTSFGACPDGDADVLAYTSDKNLSGGTSWLTTQAPVVAGEIITLDFHIWDTSDHVLDSVVMLDNFEWLIEPTEVITYN